MSEKDLEFCALSTGSYQVCDYSDDNKNFHIGMLRKDSEGYYQFEPEYRSSLSCKQLFLISEYLNGLNASL